MKIKLIKFRDDLIMPVRAHYNDAGIDCYALEDVELPGLHYSSHRIPLYTYEGDNVGCKLVDFPTAEPVMVPLGFGLEIPDGYMATIRPRSSMNKKGIITQIGTIDSGYRGEIKAVLMNLTDQDLCFERGERICQIVIEPVILADIVENLDEKEARGDGGFGSTGK